VGGSGPPDAALVVILKRLAHSCRLPLPSTAVPNSRKAHLISTIGVPGNMEQLAVTECARNMGQLAVTE